MPEFRPATASAGSLFCLEHPAMPAAHVLVIGPIKVSLCERCFAALADQTATVRYAPARGRNSWIKV